MELDITWAGPPIADLQLLSKLPDDLTKLLKSVNGFIQFGGALHVRGACQNIEWHSLRHAWESTDAFHRHYRTVKRSRSTFRWVSLVLGYGRSRHPCKEFCSSVLIETSQRSEIA
jgi:hypothetical protein